MTQKPSSPIASDRLTSAVKALSELSLEFPEKKRSELLREVELKYDLSPLECEFLDNHFSSKPADE